MRFLERTKDGGPESPVTGFFFLEIKALFSIVLLRFGGTREAYHSHAFNAVTLWLSGVVEERVHVGPGWDSLLWTAGQWKYTPRGLMHKILPVTTAWALSFRGPWAKTWQEYLPAAHRVVTLTHGRKVVNEN